MCSEDWPGVPSGSQYFVGAQYFKVLSIFRCSVPPGPSVVDVRTQHFSTAHQLGDLDDGPQMLGRTI